MLNAIPTNQASSINGFQGASTVPTTSPRHPRQWRSRLFASVVLLAVLAIGAQRWLQPHQAHASTACPNASGAQLTVQLQPNGRYLGTQFSTNFDDALSLDPTQSSGINSTLADLHLWGPTNIRLHFGFRNNGMDSLPEGQYGVWNFQEPDIAISTLRTNGLSYYLNVRTGPIWMFDSAGQLRDQTFQEFARYMARLVGWYNKGGFTDDAGVYHSSGHVGWVHTWEIWNEPNTGYTLPVPVPNPAATWMQPQDFARLFNVVVTAMRAVDPTVVVGGPTLSSYRDDAYLQTFLQNVTVPIGFASVHYYPGIDPQQFDAGIFNSLATDLPSRIAAYQAIIARTHKGTPLWIDEINIDENTLKLLDPRSTDPLSYAFVASVFAQANSANVGLISQYQFLSNIQAGLVDISSLRTYRPFWLYYTLAHTFTSGSRLLPVTNGNGTIVALAALSGDQHTVTILLGNTRVANFDDNNGRGVPQYVCINIVNPVTSRPLTISTPQHMWAFDATVPNYSMTAMVTQTIAGSGHTQLMFQERVNGYGATILQVPVHF